MSGSVWYLSLSEYNIKFERYNKYEKIKEIPIKKNKKQLQKIKKNNTKKTILAFFSFLISIFFFNFVYSEPINDTFHINLQTTFPNGTIQTGTFNFAFNITENPNLTSCEQPVVYNHSVTLTTDLRGIVSLYLPQIGSGGGNLSALSFDKQYYLCYYRDGVLRNITQLGRVPYAFRATQVNLSDVAIDTNLSLGNFNVSANYGFFSFLGSLASKITKIFAIDADISNNLDIGKNLTVSGNLSAGGVLFVNNDTGKVGIGTVTPSEALDVVGTIQSTGPFQTTSNEIIYAGSPLGQVKFFRPPTTNDIALYAGGLERVRIDSSGNVGINTSTPQATLNVLGTLNVTGASIFQASICNPGEVLTTTSTGQLVCVADQNSGGTITGQGTFGYIPLWNSSSSLNNSIIYQNGTRIGIGTTTPGEEFEVNGDILASGPFQTTSNEIIYAGSPLGQVKFFRPPTTNDIALYAGGLERVRIDSSGNVGIATTTPQQKLHVNGSAVFNGTINMDNNKIINLANGTSAQDAVTLSQLQSVNSTATNAVPQSRTLEMIGTANQISVTPTGPQDLTQNRQWTFSLPQDINTTSSPTFAGLTLSSFNQGSLIFAGANGVLSQNNAKLFWNNTTERLGINTSNPQNTLNVVGDANVTGNLILGTQATSTIHAVRADRTLTAGSGLIGGGDLTADRTFNVGAGWGITVDADTVNLSSSTAGEGLTFNEGVLNIGQGTGIIVNPDNISVNTTYLSGLYIDEGQTAGGDLGGTYPNPSVLKINGSSLGITTPTSGNILIGSGTAWETRAITGDINISSTGLTTIQPAAVTTIKIADSAVTNTKIAPNAINTTQILDNNVTLAKIQQISGLSVLGKPTTGTGNVQEILAGPDTVLGRQGSGNLAFGQIVTGQISNAAITADKIAIGAVNTTHILDGTIIDADIAANAAINWSKLSNYPYIIAGSGLTGGGQLNQNRTISVTFGTNFLGWQNLTDYPPGCASDEAVQVIGDTLTCVKLNPSNVTNGSGTANTIAKFISANEIGNSRITDDGISFINLNSGQVYLNTTSRFVGINTTTPQNTLNVVGDINATGTIYGTFSGNGSGLTNVNADKLDGYDSSFFMPLNTSVYGNFDFNGGWQNGGLSIIGGDIYARTGYFVNISALQVNNLEINGSLIPDLDNSFDLGNSSYRWRDILFSRSAIALANDVADNSSSDSPDVIFRGKYDSNVSAGGVVQATRDIKLRNIVNWNSGAGDYRLAFLNDSNSEFVTFVGNTGRVGIGTTTPQQKLHVNGSAVFNGTINMDNNKIINLANATNPQDAVTLSQLQSVNSTATNAVPQSRTLEMIGTTNQISITPTGPQDLTQNRQWTFSLPQDINTTSSPTFAGLTLSSFTQGSLIFVGDNGVLSQNNAKLFWNNTTERLGINTSTPQNTLNVVGDANVTQTMFIGSARVFTQGGDMIFRI